MSTVKWNTELPKYCDYCGRPLHRIDKKITHDKFDKKTGEPSGRAEYYWQCKNIKLFRFNNYKHYRRLVIEEPNHFMGGYSYRGIFKIMSSF